MSAAPLPAFPEVKLSAKSLNDFKVGSVGQSYYGAMSMETGALHLVPSVDPSSGQHATKASEKKFQHIATDDLHGKGSHSFDLMGAGHNRAFVVDNAIFNMIAFKKCACFSIEKTGDTTFTLKGNSGVNEWLQGKGERTLEESLTTHISEGLKAQLSAKDDSKCVLM